MYPHPIRLRGPWTCQPMDPPGPARKLQLPCPWPAAGLAGVARAEMMRRFGYPGRIDAHERVWLTVAGLAGRVRVTLNGQDLGTFTGEEAREWEVTALLGPRNLLSLEVADPAGPAGP